MSEKVQVQRMRAWWGAGRADSRGFEEGTKDRRPWLVLSSARLHQLRLVTVASVTSANSRRTSTDFLVRPVSFEPPIGKDKQAPPSSAIDTQQLWTFSRDGESLRHAHDLEDGYRSLVGKRLRTHLQDDTLEANAATETGSPLGAQIGRIVWLDLRHLTPSERSDTTAVGQRIRQLGEPWNDADVRLPAIVVASDGHRRSKGDATFSLTTVVPLIYAPAFQSANDADNPKIAIPDREQDAFSAADYPYLSAITSVLLTVDYRERPNSSIDLGRTRWTVLNERRVHMTNRGQQSWRAPEAEVQEVRASVRRLLDVELEPQTIGSSNDR